MTDSAPDNTPATPPPAVPPAPPLPRPIVRRTLLPFPLIWLVPVAAAIAVAYFIHDRHKDEGPEISITFDDATGLRPGDSPVLYRGVRVGTVTDLDFASDHRRIRATVRLRHSAADFAKSGSAFWIVRPEISVESVSGLGTVLTGPYVEARPGTGDPAPDFTALAKPLPSTDDGLTIILRTSALDRLQPDSPVYYRGVQVGSVREVRLSPDATHVDITTFIRRRYTPLVRNNSHFWTVAAADVKAGIFKGLELKLGTLRTLLSGGIAFATPDQGIGPLAHDGDAFTLHNEPEKDWLTWSPRIPLAPDADAGDNDSP